MMNAARLFQKPYRLPYRLRCHGFALITGMLILIMLTLLSVAMLKGTGLQQKIAGNTREKERAFEAAQNALRYGEYWLSSGSHGTGIPCSGPVTVTSDMDMRACSSVLAKPGDPDTWTNQMNYTPASMKVLAGGGKVTDGNGNVDINYTKPPGMYIAYLGLGPNGLQTLYSVTGVGYGGSDGTAAVVQSVFASTASFRDLGKE